VENLPWWTYYKDLVSIPNPGVKLFLWVLIFDWSVFGILVKIWVGISSLKCLGIQHLLKVTRKHLSASCNLRTGIKKSSISRQLFEHRRCSARNERTVTQRAAERSRYPATSLAFCHNRHECVLNVYCICGSLCVFSLQAEA